MSVATVTTKRMTMPEIKDKAKGLGINPGKMKKVDWFMRSKWPSIAPRVTDAQAATAVAPMLLAQ